MPVLPEVSIFIEKVCELVEKEKPDLVVILGDVLHTHERIHVTPLNKAYEFIHKMSCLCQTYVLVGNHDYENNQCYLSKHHWMNGMKEWKNVTIVDTVKALILKDMKFIFLPYVFPGRFVEALNTCSVYWDDATCIFAHQEFRGAKMGSIISIEGDQWPLEYPNVISGHIHSRQIIQDNIYYTGSAMQHAFGESEQNIIASATFDMYEKKYKLEEIDLNLPRKRIIYKDVDDMEDFSALNTKDKVKITVSGSYDQFKAFKKTQKYKDIIDTGTKVIFKPKRADVKKSKHDIENIAEIAKGQNNFKEILSDLILSEKNIHLSQVYEFVVNNNNQISHDDIFFLDI